MKPESNVQFGEGGAGTFSDGKLYSQIKDPGHRGRKVLEEFVRAGAPEEILWVAKPHIGTFRLVSMVEHMRAGIEALGGEYRWQSKVVDLELDERHGVRGVVLEGGHFGSFGAGGSVGENERPSVKDESAEDGDERATAFGTVKFDQDVGDPVFGEGEYRRPHRTTAGGGSR